MTGSCTHAKGEPDSTKRYPVRLLHENCFSSVHTRRKSVAADCCRYATQPLTRLIVAGYPPTFREELANGRRHENNHGPDGYIRYSVRQTRTQRTNSPHACLCDGEFARGTPAVIST